MLSLDYIHNLIILILLFMFVVVIIFILMSIFNILMDNESFKVFMVFEDPMNYYVLLDQVHLKVFYFKHFYIYWFIDF